MQWFVRNEEACCGMLCDCGNKATYVLYITDSNNKEFLPAEDAIPDGYYCRECEAQLTRSWIDGQTMAVSDQWLDWRRYKQKRAQVDLQFP